MKSCENCKNFEKCVHGQKCAEWANSHIKLAEGIEKLSSDFKNTKKFFLQSIASRCKDYAK